MKRSDLKNPRGPKPQSKPTKKERKLLIRLSGQLHDSVIARCSQLNVSINQWLTSLIEHDLETRSSKDRDLDPYLVRYLIRKEKELDEKRRKARKK